MNITTGDPITKEATKKLSFFPHDDASDVGSDDLSSPKKLSDGKTPVEANNVVLKFGSRLCRNRDTHDIGSNRHDDRSTESCPFEKRVNVSEKSEDNAHEDLDYDEDSITDSPSKNVPGLVAEGSNQLDNSRESRSHKNTEGKEEEHDSDSSIEEDSTCRAGQAKLRSFININRSAEDSGEKAIKSSRDRSKKSYHKLLRYFFKDTCYFQIKSINHENVELSKKLSLWSTPAQNEVRLNAAFREHRNVLLIFSVQQSGAFQGFARMTSEARPSRKPLPWILPDRLNSSNLGGIFNVEWLCTKELSFNNTKDLRNPLNDNKPIKVARDGQQVDSSVAKKLCMLFPRDSKKKLLASIETLKEQTLKNKHNHRSRNQLYPVTDSRIDKVDHHLQGAVPPQTYQPHYRDLRHPAGISIPGAHPIYNQQISYRQGYSNHGEHREKLGYRHGVMSETFRTNGGLHQRYPNSIFDAAALEDNNYNARGLVRAPQHFSRSNDRYGFIPMMPEGPNNLFFSNHPHNYAAHPSMAISPNYQQYPYTEHWNPPESSIGMNVASGRYHPYHRGGGGMRR